MHFFPVSDDVDPLVSKVERFPDSKALSGHSFFRYPRDKSLDSTTYNQPMPDSEVLSIVHAGLLV